MSIRVTRGGWASPGTSEAYRTGTWRVERPVHRHSAAPCHAACPAGEDAQAYLAALEEGAPRRAWEILVAANPLPAITGRVCHHPCERACNRGQLDEPIAIHGVERYLGDEALRQGWDYGVHAPSSGRSVAVVGAGPAGLAAAYHLAARGHRPTLFDAAPQAGGLLRGAIPPYRLPRDVLDAELERLLGVGFDTRFHHRLGRDVSLDELEADFDAVFLGPGTQRPRPWEVDGASPADLHHGLDLLREWVDMGTLAGGDRVAVVGGGNTAMDLARVLRHHGAREVHVITYQTRPGPDVPAEETMSAIPREIDEAQLEGVTIHDGRGIRRLLLRGERIVGVELVRMRKMDRGEGRREVVSFEGTETVLDVDQVIPAIGQQVDAEGLTGLVDDGFLRPNDWGRLPGRSRVWAGGDARGDHGTVTEAIGDGRRAAQAIDDALQGRTPAALDQPEGLPFRALNPAYFDAAARPEEPSVPPKKRAGGVEVQQGYSPQAIHHEAGRCLSCGNCLACDNCWTLCPDSAVLKTTETASDGSHYVFDYDYCKGCGLCARECPTGFIAMEEEA